MTPMPCILSEAGSKRKVVFIWGFYGSSIEDTLVYFAFGAGKEDTHIRSSFSETNMIIYSFNY